MVLAPVKEHPAAPAVVVAATAAARWLRRQGQRRGGQRRGGGERAQGQQQTGGDVSGPHVHRRPDASVARARAEGSAAVLIAPARGQGWRLGLAQRRARTNWLGSIACPGACPIF